MLLARKGYTLFGNTLMPIEDVDGEAPVNFHASELNEEDESGREVSMTRMVTDDDGHVTLFEGTTVVGVKREDLAYQSVADAMVKEGTRQFFDAINADKDDALTLDNAVWVDDQLFNVVALIDADKTRWYHAKLLNVYVDKVRGKLATGSVRFTVSPSGKPAFYCVRNGCACQHTWEGFAGTVFDFLWLAYVHGLNHGAAFNRPYGERVLNDPYLTD